MHPRTSTWWSSTFNSVVLQVRSKQLEMEQVRDQVSDLRDEVSQLRETLAERIEQVKVLSTEKNKYILEAYDMKCVILIHVSVHAMQL